MRPLHHNLRTYSTVREYDETCIPATRITNLTHETCVMWLVVSVMRPCAIIGRCRASNYVRRWGRASQFLHVKRLRG